MLFNDTQNIHPVTKVNAKKKEKKKKRHQTYFLIDTF